MKLTMRNGENKGKYIKVIIGQNTLESYWSAPPTSIDNVGLEYLKDRYSIINTNERAKIFKELFKNLWIDVSESQLKQMKLCLGLIRNENFYNNTPCENFMCINKNNELWNDLISKGLAEISKTNYIYNCLRLTKQGVEYVLDKSVSDKYYKKLCLS